MQDILTKDEVRIQCYKHNGEIHRDWERSEVLEVSEDYMVCYNDRVRVTESDGRSWKTKEPALLFFYKNNWFNIIAQFKTNGIYYYCNIATPYIIEENTIKYIDYDLDLRIFPDDKYKVLDEAEYEYHKELMNYPEDLKKVIDYELNNLINMYKQKEGPFYKDTLQKYLELHKNKKHI